MYVSLHNHTIYCDGESTVEEMICEASERNISYFGLSSHAPLKEKKYWTMDFPKLIDYLSEIDQFKNVVSHKMQVLKGLEADYIPGLTYSFNYFREKFKLDYIIGSVHVVYFEGKLWFIDGDRDDYLRGIKEVFNGNVQLAIRTYFDQICDMIERERPDILGHVDKILMHNNNEIFLVSDPFFQEGMQKVIELSKKYDVIIEINTRGIYTGKYNDFYPGRYSWKKLLEKDVPIILSSDAHTTIEILKGLDGIASELKDIGFTHQTIPLGVNKISLAF
ncbi:MAG: histidinol-phosphatase [Bacteroidales bacterium]|nr:histidinol-phosphatase [Bacteroidales bacterium]